MKIAIIGFGLEGQAAYDYWKNGNEVTVCDQDSNVKVPDGVNAQLGADYLKNLDDFEVIVRSPFVHPHLLVEVANENILGKVTSCTNEFMRVCPTKNIIGITGTKGKGTTSTLITKMLEAAGKRVHIGGNIGVPALELLKENIGADDWVILELSSFQLIDLQASPHIGVCLMVVPEHLDWHEDFEEYIAAKQQLFIHQDENDTAIYYGANENSVSIADASIGKMIPYYEVPGAHIEHDSIVIDNQVICPVSGIKLLGKHNWQNICAAVTAAWQVTQDLAAIHSVATSFTGLPHRLEYLGNHQGIQFYNDSFASGLNATEAAMQAIPGPKIVIVGGFERMLPLEHFGTFLKEQGKELAVKKLLVIGESAQRLEQMLTAAGYLDYVDCSAKTMPEVIAAAQALASPGDAIVLSPGFASFDMFKNFEDRGNQFKAVVEKL